MTFNISDLAKSLSNDIKNDTTNRLIKRSGTFEPGTYAVTIAAVDTGMLAEGKAIITFEGQHREHHKQVLWLTNFNGDGLSDGLETLLYGLFGDDNQTLGDWLEFISKPTCTEHGFQLMRGMKLTITLDNTEGYIIVNNNGRYYAINNKTEKQLVGPFTRRILVKRAAESNGYREPNSILIDTEPTHDDSNKQALYNSIKAILDTETSGDNKSL